MSCKKDHEGDLRHCETCEIDMLSDEATALRAENEQLKKERSELKVQISRAIKAGFTGRETSALFEQLAAKVEPLRRELERLRAESVDLHRTVDQLHEQVQCIGLEFSAVADENERLKEEMRSVILVSNETLIQANKRAEAAERERDELQAKFIAAHHCHPSWFDHAKRNAQEIGCLETERDDLQIRLDALIEACEDTQFCTKHGYNDRDIFANAIAAAKGET
jgi:chromosome segregation ATPase